MSAHTPGRWTVTTSNFSDRIHVEGRPEICIAETGNWLTHEKAEQHANARLIAAAPSLLEAAKGLVRIVEAMRMTTGLGKNQIARLEAALSAIHAATGEK